jgi:hypothetical protein
MNDEFTSQELSLLANSVPSSSDEDDVLETIDRIYNREVTKIQMGFQEYKGILADSRGDYITETAVKNKIDRKHAAAVVDAAIGHRILNRKDQVNQQIYEIFERRKAHVYHAVTELHYGSRQD